MEDTLLETGYEQWQLDNLCSDEVESPEDFLIRLETALLDGSMTEDEVRCYLLDMMS
jgi:hypothetical protein